jgi:urease accessory protein
MADELLGIMQMSDSLFPAGTFAMSNGIETMHRAGDVTTTADLEALLRSCLAHQTGPSDCAAAVQAHRYAGEVNVEGIRDLDARYLASKSVQEAREASVRSGTQMLKCIAEILHDDTVEACAEEMRNGRMSGAYPVSFGVCCRAMGASVRGTAMAVSYSFVAGCVGAALRLGIIQHVEAQGIIHNLKPDMEMAVRNGCDSDTIWQFCPQAEILQMAHEDQDSKMFIT